LEALQASIKTRFAALGLPTTITQAAKNARETVSGLLASVPNLLTTLNHAGTLHAFYKSMSATDKEQAGLQSTMEFMHGFMDTLKEMKLGSLNDAANPNSPFGKTKKTGDNAEAITNRMEEYAMQFLFDADGHLLENIAAIMALEGGTWLTSAGAATLNNRKEAINRMLNRDETTPISEPELEAFGNGTLMTNVAAQIGQRILAQANIQLNMKGLNPLFQDRLAVSLGNMTLAVMARNNRIRIRPISQKWVGELGGHTGEAIMNLVYSTPYGEEPNQRFQEHPANEELRENFQATGRILRDFFATKEYQRSPMDEAGKAPTKVSRSGMNIARKMVKNIQASMNNGYEAKEAAVRELGRWNKEGFLFKVLGQVSDEELQNTVHTELEISVNAKNAQNIRSYDHAMKWIAEKGTSLFYFMEKMHSNGRVAIDSNTINPQADKLHRFLVGMPEWGVKMSTSLRPQGDNALKLQALKVAMVLALDLKVDGRAQDAQTQAESVALFDATIAEPEFRKAIEALQAPLEDGTYSDDQEADIAVVLKEGMHSLMALRAWADMETAREQGKRAITIFLPMEVDGKTNGFAANTLQVPGLIYAAKRSLNAAGIYFDDDTFTNYAEFASTNGARDNYEQITDQSEAGVESLRRGHDVKLKRPPVSPKGKLAWLFKKLQALRTNKPFVELVERSGFLTLDRNFSKNPLMIAAYQAGMRSIRRATVRIARENFHTKLAEAGSQLENPTGEELASAIVDVIMDAQGIIMGVQERDIDSTALQEKHAQILGLVLQQFRTVEELVDFRRRMTFSVPAHPNANYSTDILEGFALIEQDFNTGMDQVYGHTLQAALEQKLGPGMEFRSKMNEAVYLMNLVFTEDFKRRLELLEKRKKRELSDRERKRILNHMITLGLVPAIKTPLSKDQLDSLQVTSLGTVSLKAKGRAYFEEAMPIRVPGYDKNGLPTQPDPISSLVSTITGMEPNLDIGVAAMVKAIHASDGTVNGMVMGKYKIMNIFDATMGNFYEMNEVAQYANEQFYVQHRDWNMGQEIFDSLSRILPLIADDDTRLSASVKAGIDRAFNLNRSRDGLVDLEGLDSIEDWLESFRTDLNQNNRTREMLFESISHINQFAKQGATYLVSKTDKEAGAGNPKRAAVLAATNTIQDVLSIMRGDEANARAEEKRIVTDLLLEQLEKGGNTQNILNDWLDNTGTGHMPLAEDVLDVLFQVFSRHFPEDTKHREHLQDIINMIRPQLTANGRKVFVGIGAEGTMDVGDVKYDGIYLPAQNKVLLRMDAIDPMASLLHEIIHAATLETLNTLETENPAEFDRLLNKTMDWVRAHRDATEGAVYQTRLSIQAQLQVGESARAISEYVAHTNATLRTNAAGGKTFPFTRGMQESLALLAETLAEPNGDMTFYSSGEEVNRTVFERASKDKLTKTNMLEVFEILKTKGPAVTSEVQELFDHILDKYIGEGLSSIDELIMKIATDPNGDRNLGQILVTAQERIALVQVSNATEFSSSVEMSAQEVAIHEILHAIVAHAVDRDTRTTSAAISLMDRVSSALTKTYGVDEEWKAFLPDHEVITDLDRKLAKQNYNHIFLNTHGNDGLHEFVVFGLSNPQFMKVLAGIDNVKTGPIWERGKLVKSIFNLYARALLWLQGEIFRQDPKNVSESLQKLAGKIIAINFKVQEDAQRQLEKGFITGRLEKMNTAVTRRLAELSLKPLEQWAAKHSMSGDELKAAIAGEEPIAKLYHAAISMTASVINPEADLKSFREAFDSAISGIEKNHPMYQMLTELLPWADRNRGWIDLMRRSEVLIDTTRQQKIEHTRTKLLGDFDPSRKHKLTVEKREAITFAILKTDLASLKDGAIGLDSDRILELLSRPGAADVLAQALEQQLRNVPGLATADITFFINQAQGLADLMIEGHVTRANQMTNVSNIVRQLGLREGMRNEVANTTQITEILEQLTTLYALNKVDAGTKQLVADIMVHENSRDTNMNGWESTLGLAQHFKQSALENLFSGNPTQMWKGYVYEVFDQEITIEAAPDTKEAEEEMARRGFTRIKKLERSKFDENPNKMVLYKSKGLGTYSKSIMSLTGMQKRGTGMFESMFSGSTLGSRRTAAKAHANFNIAHHDMTELAELQTRRPDATVDDILMLPVVNDVGEIVDYRYVMSEADKKEHLKKRDMIDEVLPRMFASIEDRRNTQVINREVVDLLHKEYLADRLNPDVRFVAVGKDVPSQEGRDLYNLMPKDTQIAITEVFGADIMYLRDDTVNLIMGFRKMSFANNRWLGPTAPAIRLGEKIWGELISWNRFRIAVLNPVVVTGNLVSNIAILLSEGIPAQYIWEESKQAILGMRKYQRDLRERNELELTIATRVVNNQSTRREDALLARLDAGLAGNPVRELVEEGMFTSIVEEFGADENSTRRKLVTKVVDKAGKFVGIQGTVKVMQEAFMVPGSETAQMALQATQYGDFVGRFIKYKWDTDVKKRDKQEAIHEALSTFIYYNIPQNRILQYMNDNGLFMFTKFFFRIQHVTARIFRRNPVQASLVFGAQQLTGNAILDENTANYAFMNGVTDKFETTPYDHIWDGSLLEPTILKWIPQVFFDFFKD